MVVRGVLRSGDFHRKQRINWTRPTSSDSIRVHLWSRKRIHRPIKSPIASTRAAPSVIGAKKRPGPKPIGAAADAASAG